MGSAVSRKAPAEAVLLIKVPCDASVFEKAAVKSDGGVIENATADTFANSNAIGFCVKKHSATVCDVQVSGATPEIFTGLDTSKDYFLDGSTPGEITTIPPTGAGKIVLRMGRPFDDEKMVVMVGPRMQRA